MISNKDNHNFDWFTMEWLFVASSADFHFSYDQVKFIAPSFDQFALSQSTYHSELLQELLNAPKI